jgi:hypothetical protein
MEILEKNRKALAEKLPKLLPILDEYRIKGEISVQRAQDGEKVITLQREDRSWHLNSMIDTAYAARVYTERYHIRGFATYFIFGISDGRHIREFLSKCNDTNHIIIGEPSLDIFAKACEQFELSDILLNKSVQIYIPDITDTLEIIMKQTLQYSDLSHVEFCILPGYDMLFHDACVAFEDTIIERIQDEMVKKGTYLHFDRAMPRNTMFNMKNMITQRNIGQLKQKLEGRGVEELPVIIVSAGPSLDKNIKELKKAEGKALIIVVDAALRAVVKAGIHPDLVCTVDAKTPERFFTGMELRDIVWCCDSLTNPAILKQYGKRIYYFGVFEKNFNKRLEQILGYPFPILPTGGSVSSIAFMLAIYLGFRKIVLIGQDLAFTGGKSHTAGIEGALGDNDAYIKSRVLMEVEGIDGSMLQTDFQMWYYKKWFERAILEAGDTLTVIDATEGGAKIEGTQIKSLREVIETECRKIFPFRELEQEIPEAFSVPDRKKLRQEMAHMQAQAKELEDYIKEQIKLQKNIVAEIEKNANITGELVAKLEEMFEANAKLEEMPLFDMMVTYAQKAEYELGDQIYEEEEMDVAEVVKQNLKLFQGYCEAVAMLQEDIGENLNEKNIGGERTVSI